MELFGASHSSKPNTKSDNRGPAIVKYKDDHGNTWGGGKGPRPSWVKAVQEAGGDLEKYRGKDAPTSPSTTAAQRLAAQGGKTPRWLKSHDVGESLNPPRVGYLRCALAHLLH